MSFTESLSDIVAGDRSGMLAVADHWERVRLRDIAHILNGFPFPSSQFTPDRGVPLLRIRDVRSDRTDAFFDGEVEEAYLVRAGELVVGMDGDFHSALWRGPTAALNQRVCKIVPDERPYSVRFLAYVLPGYLNAINQATSSITVKHLSSRTVGDIPIPLPPRKEQDRLVAAIEEHLSRLDAAVAGLKRVRAQLPQYEATVLKAAVGGRLVPTEADLAKAEGRPYEPASVFVGRARSQLPTRGDGRSRQSSSVALDLAELPFLPEGWVWTTLPELGELNRGRSRHRPRDDGRLYDGPHPFVQTGDVKHSRGVIRTFTQSYSEFGLAQSRLWPAGTLCITIAANIADTGILAFPSCFPDSVVGFRCDGHPMLVRWIELFLRTAKDELARFAPATAQKNINLKTLAALAIPIPPEAEIQRIVTEVDRRLSLAGAARQEVSTVLNKAGSQRHSILHRAFSGKLVPQDPKDEPASVLLECIRTARAAAPTKPGRPRRARAR